MIKIKNLTVRNFMSVGNQTQAIDFDKGQLTLVLGENMDLGGDDSGARNGTGKTTIINGLSYAIYGQALTNIKRDNLINKINSKGMLCTVTIEKDGIELASIYLNVSRFFCTSAYIKLNIFSLKERLLFSPLSSCNNNPKA
jgi:DNA repair exonuclease SbcCD ATPase subunit